MTAPYPNDTQGWMRRVEKRLGFLELRGGAERADFPFSLGWGTYDDAGTVYEETIARRESGLIHLFGLITRTGTTVAATTAMQVLGNLPVGFRPDRQIVRYGKAGGTASGYVDVRFDIFPTGNVGFRHLVAADFPQDTYFLDLSPVVFPPGAG